MAHGTTLGEAQIPIRAALDKLDGDLGSARGKVNGAVTGIVASVQKIGAAALAGVGIVSGVAAAAATALGKLAIDAAPVEGLQNAFEGLATSSGSSMDEMLAALKRGSSGMISQRDLMMSYNQAAQLVSTTFANQLPDAMGYLSKVSAATGQDMGFMLDSLVKGVGRLSPMILDNLGIQVSLEEATANAAAQFGVEAGELTKAQIQAGMMNVVLEKLAANTASMPAVTSSATAGLARWKATIQDTKDSLGLALQPALTEVTNGIAALAEKFLPILIDFFETKVVPVVEKVAHFFEVLSLTVSNGVPFFDALRAALWSVGLDDLAEKLPDIVAKVQDFIDGVKELTGKVAAFIKPVTDWISNNVMLQDVLIALAAIIVATVVPAVISWVVSMGPIILVVIAVIAVVALFRKLAEDDFKIVREAVAALGKAFEDFKMWVARTVTGISDWFNKTWGDIKRTTILAWDALKSGIKSRILEVKIAIINKWYEIQYGIEAIMIRIVLTMFEKWERIKQDIRDKVREIAASIKEKWNDMVEAGKRWVDGLRTGISNAWHGFLNWLNGILKTAVTAVKKFFGISSPSKVFAGIGEQLMAGLSSGIGKGLTMPVTAMITAGNELTAVADWSQPGGQRAGGDSGGKPPVTIFGGLSLNGVQDAGGLLYELQALQV